MLFLERDLGKLQAGAEDLIGPYARPTKVLLDYPAPAHFRKYEETFCCPAYFGQERRQHPAAGGIVRLPGCVESLAGVRALDGARPERVP